MNKNYTKGRAKEYRTMEKLRKAGCEVVLRSAGSHSKVDVIGINLKELKVRFIQCKPEKMSDNAKQKLVDELGELNNEFMCSFEVV